MIASAPRMARSETRRAGAHIVGAVVPLLPLHQDDLRHQQCGDQNQHHLSVHGLVTPVLHVEPLVLHSDDRKITVGWMAAAQWLMRA